MSLSPIRREPDPEQIRGEFQDFDEVPTPDVSDLNIFSDNVLLRPYQPPKDHQIKGTNLKIILPDSVDHDRSYLQNVGQVVKIGELAFKDPNVKPSEPRFPFGFFEGKWVSEGDWVIYPRNSGQKIMYKGVKMVLMKDTFLLGKLNDPCDIDVNYQTITFDKG